MGILPADTELMETHVHPGTIRAYGIEVINGILSRDGYSDS